MPSTPERPSPRSASKAPLRHILLSEDAAAAARQHARPSDASEPSAAGQTVSSPKLMSPFAIEAHSTAARPDPIDTPVSSSPTDPHVQDVCLCQRDPKIPRPRNAFILYRQHFAPTINAQNPHLTVPEQSVLIGRLWHSQPADVKAYWSGLAEQEKIRHQRQHPNYRYQPRRPGRRNSIAEASSSIAPSTCDDCGRPTARLPPTPASAAPAFGPTQATTSASTVRQRDASSPTEQRVPMTAPMAAPHRRNSSRPHPAQLEIVPGPYRRPLEDDGALVSPATKRRRMTASSWTPGGQAYAVPTFYPVTPWRGSFGGSVGTPGWVTSPAPVPPMSASLPPAGTYPHSAQHASSAHSPRAPPPSDQHSPPPAQVQAAAAAAAAVDASRQEQGLTLPPLQLGQARSSDPGPLRRQACIAKIVPPLQAPRHPNNAYSVRGSAIAIEGDSEQAVSYVVGWLEENLKKTKEYSVRVAKGPEAPSPGQEATLQDYIDLVQLWHRKSEEIKKYLTTPPGDGAAGTEEAATTTSRRLPIIIFHRYQMNGTTEWARRVPVTDSYQPSEHWSWMATLWRGIVGADMTVYIRDASAEEMAATEKAVEIREDSRCIMVRRERPGGNNSAAPPPATPVDEKTMRRLGFEISECIRNVGSQTGTGGR